MQVVMTVTAVASTYFSTPKRPTEMGLLQVCSQAGQG
jgi:hypothetical protein